MGIFCGTGAFTTMVPHHLLSRRKFNELCLGFLVGIIFGMMTLDRDYHRFGEGLRRISFRIRPHVRPYKTLARTANVHHTVNTNANFNTITVAEKLDKEIRILCWILTSKENHVKRAIYVKNTWGKHCNILIFMSSVKDPKIGSIELNITAGRKYLWGKTKIAIKHVYDHYLDKADWFLKADDDSFVIMENLRYFLQNKSTSVPVYYGCRFKPFIKQGYMSGGAGYVMSRAAVRRFVEFGLVANLGRLCKKRQFGVEDAELGRCMQAVGVQAGDSIDVGGQYRFNPFSLDSHVAPDVKHPAWYDRYTLVKQPKGLNCCSDSAISFHYVAGDAMLVLYYFVYNLHIDETYSSKDFNRTIQSRSRNSSA